MELNTISGLAIAGVICPLSVVLSMGVPIALFIAGRVKLKARISFFIGAGTYLLFAMLLEQQLHVLVIQFCGLNAQSRPWLYYVRGFGCSGFEETGRLIAMKFWMKKWLDFSKCTDVWNRAWRCGAILIGGLSGISNLVSMLMINSEPCRIRWRHFLLSLQTRPCHSCRPYGQHRHHSFCKRNRKNQCHHSCISGCHC